MKHYDQLVGMFSFMGGGGGRSAQKGNEKWEATQTTSFSHDVVYVTRSPSKSNNTRLGLEVLSDEVQDVNVYSTKGCEHVSCCIA